MGKVIYFFACLVNPVKIRYFRKMSIFVTLLIFVLEFFAILLPSKLYIENHCEYTASIYDKTYALYNVKDSSNLTGFDALKNTKLKIEDGTVSIEIDDVVAKEFTFYYEEENIDTIIIFDINEKLDSEFKKIVDEYYVNYPAEKEDGTNPISSTRVNNISQAVYYETIYNESNPTIEDLFNKYHSKSDDEINDIVKNIPYFEYYGIKGKASNKNYAYLFTKNSIIRITPDETDIFDYTFLNFDISKYDALNEFTKDLSLQMVVKYNEQVFALCLMYVVIYVLLLPIVGVLIVYLFTRKFKNLDSYFEYYKIASLFSIIPGIVGCIMSFVFGPGSKSVYIILFIVYSLLMLYKAATMSDEKDEQ